MNRRRKIKVVTGAWGDHVMLGLWNRLAVNADIEFMVLESPDGAKVSTNLPVVLFSETAGMQGFYRDLDQYLKGADLIIAIESSRLGSFQALRSAKTMGVPCAIITHEFTQLFYERFANIKAIMFDIAQNADHFFCSSRRAARLLLSEGVSEDKVTRLPRFFDPAADAYSDLRRSKFRTYIGISSDQTLAVARCSFEQTEASSAILAGFRIFLAKLGSRSQVLPKLLLIGQGKGLETLKYEASDMGIGRHVIFMAQDPAIFWRDVASAADVIIWDKWRDKVHSETYPFAFTQALSAGTSCIIPTGTVLDEVAGEVPVIRLSEMSPFDIADALQASLISNVPFEERRKKIAHSIQTATDLSAMAADIEDTVERLTKGAQGPNVRRRVEGFLAQFQDPLTRAQASDVSVRVEELLLLNNLDTELTADLWRVKGDVFAADKNAEKAVAAYEKALQVDEKCYRANRGLGYIAWTGHSHEDAMIFFKRALATEHNDYHCLVGIGLIYRRLKMLDESVFWLGRAVDMGGAASAALSLLIQACLESPEAAISLTTLEQVRESFGELPPILRGLSQVYLAQGMTEKAAPLLEQTCA